MARTRMLQLATVGVIAAIAAIQPVVAQVVPNQPQPAPGQQAFPVVPWPISPQLQPRPPGPQTVPSGPQPLPVSPQSTTIQQSTTITQQSSTATPQPGNFFGKIDLVDTIAGGPGIRFFIRGQSLSLFASGDLQNVLLEAFFGKATVSVAYRDVLCLRGIQGKCGTVTFASVEKTGLP